MPFPACSRLKWLNEATKKQKPQFRSLCRKELASVRGVDHFLLQKALTKKQVDSYKQEKDKNRETLFTKLVFQQFMSRNA